MKFKEFIQTWVLCIFLNSILTWFWISWYMHKTKVWQNWISKITIDYITNSKNVNIWQQKRVVLITSTYKPIVMKYLPFLNPERERERECHHSPPSPPSPTPITRSKASNSFSKKNLRLNPFLCVLEEEEEEEERGRVGVACGFFFFTC